jgi:hypothetical protein
MLGSALRWRAVLAAATLMTGAAGAQAQTAAYKCVSRGTVTYSQVPCSGARAVNDALPRGTDKWKKPPQDRARIARRALLSPDDRQECTALDGRLLEQEQMLKAKGEAVTLQDEMPLVRSKKRYRELRC